MTRPSARTIIRPNYRIAIDFQPYRPPGPPFHFFLGDITYGAQNSPDDVLSGTLRLLGPDLPGQDSLDPGSESDEEWMCDQGPDAVHKEGWRGMWARALITKAHSGQPLGERFVTAWSNDEQWALN